MPYFLLGSMTFSPAGSRCLKSVVARLRQFPKRARGRPCGTSNTLARVYGNRDRQSARNHSLFLAEPARSILDVQDQELLREFGTANQQVIDELNRYQDFLRNDLLPRSNGDYRLVRTN